METVKKAVNSVTGNQVLFVLTSADKFTQGKVAGKPTGWYLPELAHPYYVIKEAGYSITFASPQGGKAPLDPSSVEAFKDDAECTRFQNDQEAQKLVNETVPLFEVQHTQYLAIFYVGGHGPCFDLVSDVNSIELISKFWDAGKPVSAVCHGPVVFTNVNVNGEALVKGRNVTCFTDEEEEQAGLTDAVPELVESKLRSLGAHFNAGKAWGENVVVDGMLITGQNPASASLTAKKLVEAIQRN